MPELILPTPVFCDEAGFTGERLLDPDQPYFTYGSVAVDEIVARDIISEVRAKHVLQAPELKGGQLMRTKRGRAAIQDVLRAMSGNYLVTVYEKKLSLACKFFEYVFEPVLQNKNSIFYENEFHKFIATLVYVNFCVAEDGTVQLVGQFEDFMRSLDPDDAPILFDGNASESGMDESIADIAAFVDGCRHVILEESQHVGSWTLDLSISALWSHLAAWGEQYELVEVICDDSRPLRDLAPHLNVMVNRPIRERLRVRDQDRPITFNMSKPVAFGDSKSHFGIQLADVASSACMQTLTHSGEPWAQDFFELLGPHMHPDCVLPDYSYMDLRTPQCAVNAMVLRTLGEHARNGRDPLSDIEAWYAVGHRSVDVFIASLDGC